ncbi:MAG: DUF3987 domain-containing protein, partial [Candidatus Krumholzibacteria bacterium]
MRSGVASLRLDATTIRQAAQGRWPMIFGSLGIQVSPSPMKHGPCPACGGRDRFRFDDQDGRGTWFCNQCPQQAGDGFDLIRNVKHCDFAEALALVAEQVGWSRPAHENAQKKSSGNGAYDTVRAIWRATLPDDGRLAAYLKSRGLSGHVPVGLRLHPGLTYWDVASEAPTPIGQYPAMVAPIVDTGGKIVGLHLTYLDPAGTGKADVPQPKKMRKCGGATIAGAAIRLHVHESGKPLVLAEGIETALALHESTGWSVWACMNSGGLKNISVPKECNPVYIAADHDRNDAGQKAGRAVAERLHQEGHQVHLVLPEGWIPAGAKGRDWLDVFIEEGRDAVRGAFESSPRWKPRPTALDPIPLDTVSLPEFPVKMFPPWMDDMVEAVAAHTETPRELAAMLGLADLGLCCQGIVVVQPEPGYVEPVNIWIAAALDSGNRKTAVMQAMTRPVMDWEQKEAEAAKAKIAQIESERETIKARIQMLRSQAARQGSEDFEDTKAEIAKLEATLPEVPTLPRLWAQDITPEKLGQVMADNGERLAILSDEGGIFDILAGRYSGGIPNLDLFLQAHAGMAVRVDRRSGQDVYMQHPALTMGLSPQPEVLRGLADKPGFRGRGLLARFLYVLPPSRLGYRTMNGKPVPIEVVTAYRNGI